MSHKSALLVLSVLVIACGKAKDSSAPVTSAATNNVVEDIKLQANRTVYYRADNKATKTVNNWNQYLENLNRRTIGAVLPEASEGAVLECNVGDKKLTSAFQKKVAITKDFSIANVNSADCTIRDNSGLRLAKTIVFKRDVLVKGNVTMSDLGLTEMNDIANLVFVNGGVLTTEGNDLTINALKVVSQDGKIQTFKENSEATMDKNGKDGGIIDIKSEHSLGSLTVVMRGQKGGASSVKDETDYSDPATVRRVHRKLMNGVCANIDMPVELDVKDSNGVRGGNSGIFRINSKKNSLAIKVESFGGAGGDGGLSYLANKSNKIPARFIISDALISLKKQPGDLEWGLKDDYSIKEMVTCGPVTYKCAYHLVTGVEEFEPNRNKSVNKSQRCKPEGGKVVRSESLATHIHVKQLALQIDSQREQILTRGPSGLPGVACVLKKTKSGATCQ